MPFAAVKAFLCGVVKLPNCTYDGAVIAPVVPSTIIVESSAVKEPFKAPAVKFPEIMALPTTSKASEGSSLLMPQFPKRLKHMALLAPVLPDSSKVKNSIRPGITPSATEDVYLSTPTLIIAAVV